MQTDGHVVFPAPPLWNNLLLFALQQDGHDDDSSSSSSSDSDSEKVINFLPVIGKE